MPRRRTQLSYLTHVARRLKIRRKNETSEERVNRITKQKLYSRQRYLHLKALRESESQDYIWRANNETYEVLAQLKTQSANNTAQNNSFNSAFSNCNNAYFMLTDIYMTNNSAYRDQVYKWGQKASPCSSSGKDYKTLRLTYQKKNNMDVPREIKQESLDTYEDINFQIKIEQQLPEDTQLDDQNPFQNVQVEVKQEIPFAQNASPVTDNREESPPNDEYNITKKTKLEYNCVEKTEMEETVLGDDSLVTYDYPDFGDHGNDEDIYGGNDCDSKDTIPLAAVETYLHNIKSENVSNFEENEKEQYDKINIKEEPDITVTETHLISNKLINTTSTVTNTNDGGIESQTTNTLVMEILPVAHSTNLAFSTTSYPEEILPTLYHDVNSSMGSEASFQLNSITGNLLSLEQEAYSQLKTRKKREDRVKKLYVCPKCSKTYKTKFTLNAHLQVHVSIEKRARGIMKYKETRKRNREIKLQEEALSVNKYVDKYYKYELESEDAYSEEEDDRKSELKSKPLPLNSKGNFKKNRKTEVEFLKLNARAKRVGAYECTCGEVFKRRSRMETCLRSHNIRSATDSFNCVTCSKQFKNKEELVVHRKRLHSKRFPCKFCPTDYPSRKELFRHLQIHQKVQLMEYKAISEVVQGKQKLKCFMCSKLFKEMPDLKSHVMDDHKEPYSCPLCNDTFSKIIDFAHHTKTSHPEVEGQSVLDVLEAFSKLVKAWKCEECGLQFHEADKLAMHKIESHSPDLKAEPQFQCDDCRRVFISQKGLTSHRRIHHSTETLEESAAVETGVLCLECRKMCKDMNALVSHTRFHSPERKFPCKFCDFRFATAEKRKAHAEIHTGDMKYVCFICEYQCTSENRLRQHKRSLKHLNMKEFLLTGKPLVDEGQSTSKEDAIKNSLQEKEWVVNKKSRKESSDSSSDCVEVTCDICGDKFENESVMLEHKQTHPFIEFPNEDNPSRIFFK